MAIHKPHFSSCEQAVLESLEASGLSVIFRINRPDLWQLVSEDLAYLPVAYSSPMIDYQISYFSGSGIDIYDISLVIFYNKRPCAIWPLSLSQLEVKKIGSNGGPIMPPIFVNNTSSKVVKKITTLCLHFLDTFCRLNGVFDKVALESYESTEGISQWQNLIMSKGGRVKVRYELFTNMKPDLLVIKSNIRNSFKSLINVGERLWDVQIMTSPDSFTWETFRALHQRVAGRVTRSGDSWKKQIEAINSKAAFLVYINDKNTGLMVGGGFFYTTRDECLYAVGAYDRSLFHKPLGHVIQYRAMQEMKTRNIKWYKLGDRPYGLLADKSKSKETTIADFKQGFATHIFPCFELSWQ